MPDRIRDHAEDLGVGVLDTIAILALVDLVAGVAAAALATSPLWVPAVVVLRARTHAAQRRTYGRY
jgi:hypothetical protein